MVKVRPKFPRRNNLLRFRLAAFAMLLLVVVGGFFYLYGHEDREVGHALDLLADSLATHSGQTASETPPVAGKKETATQLPSASRVGAAAEIPPQQHKPEKDSPPLLSGSQTPPVSPGTSDVASHALTRQSVPFEGLSLGSIASFFAKTYGGRKPVLWGERLPGITQRLPVEDKRQPAKADESPPRPILALTLDACGGRKGTSYDSGLIAFLRENNIPATIFVTSIWVRNNPDILRELAADPLFEIAAHGLRHKPCSVNGNSVYGIKGTASFDELVREVEGNARDIFEATGKRPRWFRSGTAYYDDVAVQVIRDLGLGIAGYSITGDEGATLSAPKVRARTVAAKDGDILLYHLNHPQSGTREGLKQALPLLLEKGCRFVRLSDL